ncbi:MAG: AtpZ/AtpI family protein, partial [Bacteroidota bacterium]
MDKPNPKRKGLLSPESARAFAKYSGMAFQMGIIIVFGVLGGQKLDALLNTDRTMTLICSLISVFLAMYIPLKDFIVPSKKE